MTLYALAFLSDGELELSPKTFSTPEEAEAARQTAASVNQRLEGPQLQWFVVEFEEPQGKTALAAIADPRGGA